MATDQIEILRGIRTGLVTHVDDLQVLINHAGTPEEQVTLVSVQHSLRNAIDGIQEVITKRYRADNNDD
jgi:hypothetical protein